MDGYGILIIVGLCLALVCVLLLLSYLWREVSAAERELFELRGRCYLEYGGITRWGDGDYVSANWHCSECGGTLPASSEYCLHCGRKVVR